VLNAEELAEEAASVVAISMHVDRLRKPSEQETVTVY